MTEVLVRNKKFDLLKFKGVGMGPLALIAENIDAKLLVVHEAGHKYFGGQSRPQEYSPARIRIYRWLSRQEDDQPDGNITYIVSYARGDISFHQRFKPGRKPV